MRPWILGGLLIAWCAAAPAATRAKANSTYADCVEAADPADCLARRAAGSSGLRPRELIEAVLRHGLVDLVPGKSAVLMRGLDRQISDSGATQNSAEVQLKMYRRQMALHEAKASRSSRPWRYWPPRVTRLIRSPTRSTSSSRNRRNDPRIPVLAMATWVEFIGMNGWAPDFRVTHAGLPAIWERAVARRQLDAALLANIAGDLGSLDELKPQAREFLLWYAQRPAELTTDQRVQMAMSLARYFDEPETAASLLEGLGDVPEWSMFGVRTDIAVARLAKGYDAASARQFVNNIVGVANISRPRLHDSDPAGRRDALERSGARNELRELGAAYVREAEATDYPPFKSERFAAASDYYLRAGDRERALELARRALPYMPDHIRALGYFTRPKSNDPAAKAIAMRGVGTDAVIALYRAGAIDEALQYSLPDEQRSLSQRRACGGEEGSAVDARSSLA